MHDERESIAVRIITNEEIVHSQIRSIKVILDRELEIKVRLNRRGLGSQLEFQVFENDLQLLQERLGCTILRKNEAGWIPVI